MALVLAATFLHAEGVLAKTFVVTKGVNCYPQVVSPLYPTIKAALDAVPIAANATHVVIVCPGTYPEQVKITKNVTITGVLRDGTDPAAINGNSAEAKIVAPPGGLVTDPDFLGNVAAQVSAQNVADLNLTNLTIDGEGIGCPLGADGLPIRTAGIAFYNVGVVGTGSRGTVNKTVLHNQLGTCTNAATGLPERSYTAEGILAENSWFTLDANSLSNIDLNPIHQFGGISKITNNYVALGWHGILLSNATATAGTSSQGSTISGNMLSSFSTGIYLVGSSNVLVTLNTLTNWTGDAIAVIDGSSDNAVTSNKIVDAWHGIYLNTGAARNVVKSNTIVRTVKVAIVDAFSGGGNLITGNTIQQSPIGIFLNSPADDVFLPNTFYNTTVLTDTGSIVP